MATQEETPFRGLATSWPALAAMAITVLSFLVAGPRLESPRPTGGDAVAKVRVQDPVVPARLWQDPLVSVIQGPLNCCLKVFTIDMPGETKDEKGNAKPILVLLAFMEPELDPEAAESRRRERYATLSALNTAGYEPVESERLSYVDLEYTRPRRYPDKPVPFSWGRSLIPAFGKSKKSDPGDNTMRPDWIRGLMPAFPKQEPKGNKDDITRYLRVPFEWVQPMKTPDETPKYRGVCVAWIYEHIDPWSPLRSLMFIKDKLAETIDGSNKKCPRCDFAITGRITSTILDGILYDDSRLAEDSNWMLRLKDVSLPDVQLFVTYATAKSVRDKVPQKTLPNSQLKLEYVIGTDDLLIQSLVAELESRKVHTRMQHAKIAVIAEWDTTYGRAIRQEFFNAAHMKDADTIRQYSYLRGLDGKLPGKAETPPADDKGADTIGKPAASSEKPNATAGEGDAQIDYLRRLVERMRADHVPFRAIGVLGSDTYDKLLILTALRASFPEALFFTTDLDNRMLQPAEVPATRNLLVASHFGLSLRSELQKTIPPFRSSYDTASYLGCLMAVQCPLLDVVKAESLPEDTKLIKHPVRYGDNEVISAPVHLYQIGRHGAFELTAYNGNEDPLADRNHQRRVWYFEGHWWRLGGVPVCLVLLGFLSWTVSRGLQRFLRELAFWRKGNQITPRHVTVVLGVLLLSLMAGLIVYSHRSHDQEPFSMVEGISVWPTVIFRLLAVIACLHYIADALRDLTKQDAKLRKDFNLEERPAIPWRWRDLLPGLDMWSWSPKGENAREIWEQFEKQSSFPVRARRCLAALVAYAGFATLLWFLFDHPMFWGRGSLAHGASLMSLILAIGGLICLVAFVVDATVLMHRFVGYLVRNADVWSEKLLEDTAENRGLRLPDDPDDPLRAALKRLLIVRYIAASADVVSHMIYYPFVVVLLLIVAQSPLFEAWHWNSPLILIAILSAGAALTCCVIFQRTAKEAPRRAMEEIEALLAPLTGKANKQTRANLRKIRTEIEEMDSGIYAGLARNPVVYAVLLPLCGGGGLAALEALLPHL